MIEANTATYDVPGLPGPRPTMATAAEHPAPRYSIRRAHPRCVDPAALAPAAWQVREDPAFYIPDVLSEKHYSADAELYDAADEHARHLRGAQRTLEDALNLVGVLSASLSEEGDSRAVELNADPDRQLRQGRSRSLQKRSKGSTMIFPV